MAGSHPLYDRAALYEAAFRWDAAPEAAFYDRVLGPGTLLDVGCGTGRVMQALAARGRRVTGIELSLPMAARAIAAGLDVKVADMRAFRTDAALSGAFSHLSTFRYLTAPEDPVHHLDAMAAALPVRGMRYAIDTDFVGPDFDPSHPGQTWRMPGPDGLPVEATWRAVSEPAFGLVREECVVRWGDDVVRHDEELLAWSPPEFAAFVDDHAAFRIAEWHEPPFEIYAPFRPRLSSRAERTGRAVVVLERR